MTPEERLDRIEKQLLAMNAKMIEIHHQDAKNLKTVVIELHDLIKAESKEIKNMIKPK